MAAPNGLSRRAKELWTTVTTQYTMRVDELFVLESACREIDLIDRMESEQQKSGLIGVGSQGQPVAAPLLAELRSHRALFAAHMKQLSLPDVTGRKADKISEQARSAAQARWGRTS